MGLFSKREPKERPVRVFFVTDLHGSTQAWGKMLSAADAYGAQALICGGDVAGKRLYPIVNTGADRYRATVADRKVELDGESAIADAKKRIAAEGGYARVMDAEEAQRLEADRAAMEEVFAECVRERLAEWVETAERRLQGTGVKCYVTGGNDDEVEMLTPLLEPGLESVIASEDKVVDVVGHPMVSLGWSNETPWKTPRETSEEELSKLIDRNAGLLDDYENAIFNFHVPPKDSTLDSCPELDTSTDPPTPIVIGNEVVMFGAGSTAVKEAIERYQPMLSLHGHIHEATGITTIGRTTSINPGSEYHNGSLLGAIVVLRKNELVNYQLTRG